MLLVSWLGMVIPETSFGMICEAIMWTTFLLWSFANLSTASVLPIPGLPSRHRTIWSLHLSAASMRLYTSSISFFTLVSTFLSIPSIVSIASCAASISSNVMFALVLSCISDRAFLRFPVSNDSPMFAMRAEPFLHSSLTPSSYTPMV